MSKEILVITGSPRKNGNSNAMAAAFIKAAEARGNNVCVFDAASANLNGCHACGTCYKTGNPCSFDDDFNKVAPMILKADVIVFSMPVYWFGIPSQIKAVIDKLYSFIMGEKEIAGKGCALISCCEENDISTFDGVRIPIERTAEYLNWKMIGEVLVPGITDMGDVEKTDGCSRAAALAEKI